MPEKWSYLVVSDLHLSQGRHPTTGCLSPKEDFLFDDEFCALLDDRRSGSRWSDHHWKLILNGDIMDLLQVTEIPNPPLAGLSFSKYGLKAGPAESVWKLHRVIAGHPGVFQSLARFASRFPVIVVAGNHDVEWFFPQVREALISHLESIIEPEVRQRLRENIEFREWFYLDAIVYAEHGHQYDSLNSFQYILDPRLPAKGHLSADEVDHIDLPMGSLFVRYLFNRIETRSPFADNIKPATRFLGWLCRNQPKEAIRYFLLEGHEVLRRTRRNWKRFSTDLSADRQNSHQERLTSLALNAAQQMPQMGLEEAKQMLFRLEMLADRPIMVHPAGWKWRLLRLITGPHRTPLLLALPLLITMCAIFLVSYSLLEPLIPRVLLEGAQVIVDDNVPGLANLLEPLRWLCFVELVVVLLWLALRSRRAEEGRKLHLREKAKEIQLVTKVPFVTMGHTHDPDIAAFETGGRYYNTGSWTKVFSREEQLVREEKELTFLQIVPNGLSWEASLQKWESHGGRGRPVDLFEADE